MLSIVDKWCDIVDDEGAAALLGKNFTMENKPKDREQASEANSRIETIATVSLSPGFSDNMNNSEILKIALSI